jgi:hypothetical protein
MPSLLIDRRLATCSASELNALHAKLASIICRWGVPDLETAPAKVVRQWHALEQEYARRGVQLALF